MWEIFYDEQHAQWCVKASRKYRTRKLPDNQNVFLSSSSSSSSSSSDKVFQIAWLFHNGFRIKQQHFTLSSAPAHLLFHNYEVSWGASEPVKEEIWLQARHHFLHLYSLSNETYLLRKIAELEIQWYAWRVWTEPGLVNDSSANTAYVYWGSLWGQTCCSVIDGNSMHLVLKKVT